MPADAPRYYVTLIIDGQLVASREYSREHAAVRAYDKLTALYSVGTRRPKETGIASVRKNFEPFKRCEWKPGFGWY